MKDRMNVYFGSYVTYCYLSVNKEFVCVCFVSYMRHFGSMLMMPIYHLNVRTFMQDQISTHMQLQLQNLTAILDYNIR